MKIYAISDLHISLKGDKPMDIFGGNWKGYLEKIKEDWNKKVEDEDVVLLAGDMSWAMDLDEAIYDISVLKDLKGKKIICRGNHDYWWKSITRVREKLPPNFYALQNDSIKIGNFVICGSRAWSVEGSPDFKESDRKIYYREVERLNLALSSAKKVLEEGDKLICLIHYPPFNVKREISKFVEIFNTANVDAVVYGHLHGKNSRTDLKMTLFGIDYYLTSCDITGNELVRIF